MRLLLSSQIQMRILAFLIKQILDFFSSLLPQAGEGQGMRVSTTHSVKHTNAQTPPHYFASAFQQVRNAQS